MAGLIERPQLSALCADVGVELHTGQPVVLWAPGDGEWRHRMCRSSRGRFRAGVDGQGEHIVIMGICTCMCHETQEL